MSLNTYIIKDVINGDEKVSLLMKQMSVFDMESELKYLIKVAYEIGHRDARHDACQAVDAVLGENTISNRISNIKLRCEL